MNKKIQLSRRQLLIFASSSIVTVPLAALADSTTHDIHVVKNPQCGCCNAWIKILEGDGFNVTTEDRSGNLLASFKVENGIPKNMMPCHTAKIDGYFIEGHVPPSDIKRLIEERPDALGWQYRQCLTARPGWDLKTSVKPTMYLSSELTEPQRCFSIIPKRVYLFKSTLNLAHV
jgi:hypothetical protein